MNEMSKPAAIKGEEHWTQKDGGVKLFLDEKCAGDPAKSTGTILFVHGSSMASQPPRQLRAQTEQDILFAGSEQHAASFQRGAHRPEVRERREDGHFNIS